MLQALPQSGQLVTGGLCAVQASVALPRSATLTQINSTNVTIISALNIYALPGDTLSVPLSSALLAPAKASSSQPLRLLKCDWRNYQTR